MGLGVEVVARLTGALVEWALEWPFRVADFLAVDLAWKVQMVPDKEILADASVNLSILCALSIRNIWAVDFAYSLLDNKVELGSTDTLVSCFG